MLCWLDVETSGLDERERRILEIAIIVTDDDLFEQCRFHSLVRFLGEDMDPMARVMHERSGLLALVRAYEEPLGSVEQRALDWLEESGVPPGVLPLAGSSVAFDRRFLRQWMPKLLEHFHYRNVDVSTITELVRRWYPAIYEQRPGASTPREELPHRALDDIEMSLSLARYYRHEVFRAPTGWGD